MQYCVDHPEEINKLAKVQAQVSEVKNVMMENIEKVHLVLCGLLLQSKVYDLKLKVIFENASADLTLILLLKYRFLIVERRLSCLLTRQKISAHRS